MTISPMLVTGNEAFDYMFTLVFVFGMISIGPALLFKLMRF